MLNPLLLCAQPLTLFASRCSLVAGADAVAVASLTHIVGANLATALGRALVRSAAEQLLRTKKRARARCVL
jgi:hypothetical protein